MRAIRHRSRRERVGFVRGIPAAVPVRSFFAFESSRQKADEFFSRRCRLSYRDSLWRRFLFPLLLISFSVRLGRPLLDFEGTLLIDGLRVPYRPSAIPSRGKKNKNKR